MSHHFRADVDPSDLANPAATSFRIARAIASFDQPASWASAVIGRRTAPVFQSDAW